MKTGELKLVEIYQHLLKETDHSKTLSLTAHKYLTYFMIILAMAVFHVQRTQGYLEPYRYDLSTFLNLIPWSISLLFGQFLATLALGAKLRFLIAVLMLPSFGFVLATCHFCGNVAGALMFATFLWSYFVIFRRDKL